MHKLDPLTPAEARLIALERRRGLQMHSGTLLVFDGAPLSLAELSEHVRAALPLVPRYRGRVRAAPLARGGPLWVQDPQMDLERHVRAIAVEPAGGSGALERLVGELLSTPLDHAVPLWELWLIEQLADGRFALLAKTHHALVDGAHNGELASLLLHRAGEAPSRAAPDRMPAGAPAGAALVLGALAARARNPRELIGGVRELTARAREELEWRELLAPVNAGSGAHPRLNVHTGTRRRFAGVDVSLRRLRRVKERLGGTVNDAVLTAVAGAIGAHLREHGEDTAGVVLRALVPLVDARSGGLLAINVPLPVGIADPRRRHAEISRALDGLRESGRALGADVLSELEGFAPPALAIRAARLQARERALNLTVTNLPGPREARFLLGRVLHRAFPALAPGRNQALSVALTSYAGRLCFGLLADRDALPDLDRLAELLAQSVAELPRSPKRRREYR